MLPILVIGAVLLGLCVGSFIAARVVRTIKGHPQNLWGRSVCMHCGHVLGARDLVPLFSYIFSRGVCRHCREPYSPLYVRIELATAMLFGLLMWLGLTLQIFPVPVDNVSTEVFLLRTAEIFAILGLLVYVSAVDMVLMAFPVNGLGIMMLLVLAGAAISGYPVLFFDGVLGAVVLAGSLAVIRLAGNAMKRGEVMGSGDLWVAALVGASVGLKGAVIAFYGAFLSGALVAVVVLLRRRTREEKPAVPFAPFLAMGWFIALLWGNQLFSILFPF